MKKAYEGFIHKVTAVTDKLPSFNASKNDLKDWFSNKIAEKDSKMYKVLGICGAFFNMMVGTGDSIYSYVPYHKVY